jgi:2-polyprenyl-3-methyl-5-hydroxy-6-metoxy-1,4-benzoquinol methylase
MQETIERIIPETISENDPQEQLALKLHLERYEYAGRFALPGKVADIACGVGYGSYFLATSYFNIIDEVYAADINESAIAYGMVKYNHPKIKYNVQDAMNVVLPNGVNTVVCLETIEHLPDPFGFIANLSKQLLKNSRIIASVPVTPSMDANPYHLHDFSITAIQKIFEKNGFKKIDSFVQVQEYNPLKILSGKSKERGKLRKSILKYYLQHPQKLLLRVKSIIKDGFANKYFIGVYEKI